MRNGKHRLFVTTICQLGLVASTARVALAEPTGAERAAAEALFESAASLMNDGKFAEACTKFEGSLELDAALGTRLRLADCYDRIGRTASAWAAFQDVVSLAHSRGETAREQMASERASDLEKRLSRLRLRVDPASSNEISVRVGSTRVPRASFDSSLPLDPGPEHVEVSAPGKRTWSTTIDIAPGPALQTLVVPPLERATAPARSSGSGGHAEADVRSSSGSTQRTLGYVAGGIALAGLATGGFLAYRADAVNKRSLAHCRPEDSSACTAEGVSERDDARKLANGATVATIAGGALFAGGLILVLTAPSGEAKSASAPRLHLAATVGDGGTNVNLLGRW